MGNNQGQEVIYGKFREDKPAKAGYSRELINIKNISHPDNLVPSSYNDCTTLWHGYEQAVKRNPQGQFLGTRNSSVEGKPYEWKSFQEVDDISRWLANGIKRHNFIVSVPYTHEQGYPHIAKPPAELQFVGIYAKNREEWAIVDLALMRSSITIIPFFDSLGPAALTFVIKQTGISTMFVEANTVENVIKSIAGNQGLTLKNIVSFDPLKPETLKKLEDLGLKYFLYSDIIEEGKKHDQEKLVAPTPDSVYIFTYTSGTTGDPKASIISHSSLLADLHIFDAIVPAFGKDDISISYLPYAHIMEQCAFIMSIFKGSKNGFYSGNPLTLFDDMIVLKPTFFITVPRILSKVYSKIFDDVSKKSSMAQWLFNKAVNSKTENYLQKCDLDHALYDKLIFGKVKEKFGGNLKYMITASAPISPDVLTFFKVALGINIFEIYGQTETIGPATCTSLLETTGGHVGGVVVSLKLRTKDIPEMNYYSTDAEGCRGELQFQGINTFKGYYKNLEKTEEAFDYDTEEDRKQGKNGWVNSGDVAIIYPNGAIKIFDRAKNIFKLSQGEYIAPEKLENIYGQLPPIAQIFVHGDSLQAYILAIVVPNPDYVKEYQAKHEELKNKENKDFINTKEFKAELIAVMNKAAASNHLNSLEKIKKIFVTEQAFTVQNDLLTPTFKLKRNNAKKLYEKEIKQMYDEGEIF